MTGRIMGKVMLKRRNSFGSKSIATSIASSRASGQNNQVRDLSKRLVLVEQGLLKQIKNIKAEIELELAA